MNNASKFCAHFQLGPPNFFFKAPPLVIGDEQSAFVPGRLIKDNVLVAYESIHAMKKKKKGKNSSCAVKLDMLKAFDRVEWHYLEAMMTKLGFCDKFIRLVMKCVSSVRFSVKVNGTLLPFFQPTKGLRQGCPMSPFLFLIYAEGFTSLMNNFGGPHIDREIPVSVRSPWVNHLLFAKVERDPPDLCSVLRASSEQSQNLNLFKP